MRSRSAKPRLIRDQFDRIPPLLNKKSCGFDAEL